jgi:hypothetical protein
MAEALSRLIPNGDCLVILVIRHGQVYDVCYELGSVAFPYPPLLSAARLFGFLGPLFGLALLGFDFAQRKRNTSETGTGIKSVVLQITTW